MERHTGGGRWWPHRFSSSVALVFSSPRFGAPPPRDSSGGEIYTRVGGVVAPNGAWWNTGEQFDR
jgi:hypothetical protein